MSTTIAMFSDYACPWCYLGRARLKAASEQVHVTIAPVHFALAADTPPEGRDLTTYLANKGIDASQAIETLRALLKAEGLPYMDSPQGKRTYSTRRAQILAVWAHKQPGGDAIHDAIFHAYHVDNVNVADTDVLVGLATQIGLDGGEARAALDDPQWSQEVDRHWALAAQIGVRSVPTYVSGGQGVVGAQDVDTLVAFARKLQTEG